MLKLTFYKGKWLHKWKLYFKNSSINNTLFIMVTVIDSRGAIHNITKKIKVYVNSVLKTT